MAKRTPDESLPAVKRRKVLGNTERVFGDIPNNQLPEIVLEATMANTMRDFVGYTAEKFQRAIHDLDVRDQNNLYESVQSRISTGRSKITGTIDFNFYGRFVDMGVGKGVTLIEKQTGRALTKNRNPSRIMRQPKRWFSKVWFEQQHKLQEVLTRDVAKMVESTTQNALPDGDLPLTI